MIPQLINIAGSPWNVLPPGIHLASLADVEATFTYNARRRNLFDGLLHASVGLVQAGCQTLLLDGSYVTAKPVPGDYDACWEPSGIEFSKLDPVFGDFSNSRANQKSRFGGEFFPATMIAKDFGAAFPELFQTDKFTGSKKGILKIAINIDEAVMRRMKP